MTTFTSFAGFMEKVLPLLTPRTSETGAALIPSGTVDERPTDTRVGLIRRNTELELWEGWDGTKWAPFAGNLGESRQNNPRTWKTTPAKAQRIVLTGDSLSYNHQDFDSTPRQNAEDCWPGMNSWSFALRDTILKSGDKFIHGDEIIYSSETFRRKGTHPTLSAAYTRPFNGRTAALKGTAGTLKLYIKNDTNPDGVMYLYYLKDPSNTAMSFRYKVNGVLNGATIDTYSTGGAYQGYELMAFDISIPFGTVGIVELFSMTGTHPTPHPTDRMICFCGASSNYATIKQTGRGGQSSKWLADNVVQKITDHAPDLLIFTIGANDPWSGNPQGVQTVAQFQVNLRKILSETYGVNPLCQVVYISQPYTNQSIYSNEVVDNYVSAAKLVVEEFAAAGRLIEFVDTRLLFKFIPAEVHRFDSIHYSKRGNAILLQRILDILGLSEGVCDVFDSAGAYTNVTPNAQPTNAMFEFTGVVSFPILLNNIDTGMILPISVMNFVSPSVLRLDLNVSGEILKGVHASQVDQPSANLKMAVTVSEIGLSQVTLRLNKLDGTPVTQADWDAVGNTSSFRFLISVL